MQNLNFSRGFMLLITPITPLVLSVTSSPSLAATLASSEATVNISNFSTNPSDILTLADTDTDTFASNGSVTADADAVATFIQNPSSAANSSFSITNGDGSEYFGFAKSQAAVIGYNFLVNSGETFSFDFVTDLNLKTSIDNPQFESANATGNIVLKLYDTTNGDNWIDLDSFTIVANLATSGNNDYLYYDASDSITLSKSDYSDTSFGGNQETAEVSTEGSFSRTFENLTNLTLVEVKTNEASVSVPEPSTILGLVLGMIGIGYRITNKAFRVR